VTACIGEPISWLRLERFALGEPDPAIALHTAACPACRRCLDQIRSDVVALPPLELPAELELAQLSWLAQRWRRARRWWRVRRRCHSKRSAPPALRRRWPALVLAAALVAIAALAVIVVVVPRDSTSSEHRIAEVAAGIGDFAPDLTRILRSDSLGVVAVKGVGEVRVELVRERAGEVRFDATRFAHRDRWKVIVTCAPSATVWVEVSVNDGVTIDRPIAPAQLRCGNRIVVPGAFTITGIGAHRVCARVAPGPGAQAQAACATVRPE
jgi:hypothetical protein